MREPANASATSAGTCAFIAQVKSSWPDEPNLRPAMNTTLASFGSASICWRSRRSAAMHSTPQARELLAQVRLAEARDADHALAGRRALGEPRQGRSDLAADAQDDEVARKRAELGAQHRRRRRHHLFEVLNVAKTFRQRGGRGGHPGVFLERQAVATVSA